MCPPPGLHKFPKEAQGLLWSLLLPSRPGVAQQGLPGHLLLSVLSLPAPPSLLPGPFTRPLVRERGKEKKKKRPLTASLHFPPQPPSSRLLSQAGGPETRNAQALSLLRGTQSSTLCAGAIRGCARTHWPTRTRAGERAQGAQGAQGACATREVRALCRSCGGAAAFREASERGVWSER